MTSVRDGDCLFCRFRDDKINRVLIASRNFYVRWDNFPASPGHVEVVPKHHVESWFELTGSGVTEAYELMKLARDMLDDMYCPAGYTIGVNEGRAAGRTVDHLHVHMIPRCRGDVPDPRGGIRHVLPGTDPDHWASGTADPPWPTVRTRPYDVGNGRARQGRVVTGGTGDGADFAKVIRLPTAEVTEP